MIRLRATFTGAKCRFESKASAERVAINAAVHIAPRRNSRRVLDNVVISVCMASFPKWLVPMAATLTQERFTGRSGSSSASSTASGCWRTRTVTRRAVLAQSTPARHTFHRRSRQEPSVKDAILDGEITWGPEAERITCST
jgi:hypothetical protein